VWKKWFGFFKRIRFSKKSNQKTELEKILGFAPNNPDLYKIALRHASALHFAKSEIKETNGRLEFLGDAILGAVTADYLYKKYPFGTEGFLTELRSKLVNRDSLNQLSQIIKLTDLLEYDVRRKFKNSFKSIGGDALEAIIGAIYLDKGFETCKKFIENILIQPNFDLDKIILNQTNYKSLVLEWSQRYSKKILYQIVEEKGVKHQREFVANLFVDDKIVGVGSGFSKKKAEQAAAQAFWMSRDDKEMDKK